MLHQWSGPLLSLSQVQVMMGPEEVLIKDGEVSVKGQPVPVGEPRLLHGEDGVPTPEGRVADLLHPSEYCWEAFEN